jgi:hypothetical protein
MRTLVALAALSLALGASPANAFKFVQTGVTTVDPFSRSADLPLPWPFGGVAQGTTYRVSVQFSRPADWFNITYIDHYSFIYCDYTLNWCGGDDYDIYSNIGAFDTNSVVGSFTTGKDSSHRTVGPWGNVDTFDEWYEYAGGYFDNQFSGDDPLGYRFVLQSIPEPASWSLMIAGFGLIGGSLRARRRPAVS